MKRRRRRRRRLYENVCFLNPRLREIFVLHKRRHVQKRNAVHVSEVLLCSGSGFVCAEVRDAGISVSRFCLKTVEQLYSTVATYNSF
jgi:hypothetical protein